MIIKSDEKKSRLPAVLTALPDSAVSADEGQGLRIHRLHTRPGVHPYDEVTWERRTAQISGDDGQVVFKQEGVEVPSFWSQMATNVVVSKYFRGAVGAPGREWSVKQLLSRVVDTIAQWGRAGGYFATDEDADAFRAELAHLVLHQKMSFNSPVWFNLGIEPRPQGSACQPYHARVLTVNGPIPIGDLVEKRMIGLPVYDGDGLTQVVAVKANGTKPVFRIELTDGYTVEATGDHLVCAHNIRRTGRIEWRRVDQLEVGMVLRVYPHAAETVTRPGETREVAEAALAAWLQADGFVGQYDKGTNRSLTIEFMTNGDEEHDWVLGHLATVFPEAHSHTCDVETVDPKLKVRRVRLYGEHLRPFVEKYDLMKRGLEIRVPRAILEGSNEGAAAYLKSVFQAEGYAMVHGESAHVALAVISPEWIRDLQVLLTRFGIYSRVRQKKEKRDDRYNLWEVDISILSERRQFARRIGFLSERKRGLLAESLELDGKDCPDIRYSEIVGIRPLGEMDVYDIQTVSGQYLSEGVLVHNCFINSINDSMESIMDLARTEALLFKYGSGTGTNLSPLRSSKERLSTGGVASGPVSFMKGFDAFAGVIKSGGKCYRETTCVATPSGWRAIETLRIGDKVLTHEGEREILDVMPNGVKQCFRVRSREGYEVEVTEGHKFAYWDAAEGRFLVKPIEEFSPGGSLYVLAEASEEGERIPLHVPEANDPPQATTTVEMRLPTELDDRLAYVLGLMYGDAELRTENPYRVRVSFAKTPADVAAAARFRRYGAELFGEEPIVLGDFEGWEVVGYTRKRLVEFLVANGIAKGKAEALGFPHAIFRARPEVRAAFVAGVLDADGTYQPRGGWSLSSVDRAFLVQFQRLLLSLGVPSKIKLSREAKGTWLRLWKLSVVGHTFIARLVRRIAPYSAKATHDYVPSDGEDKGWGYRPSLYVPLRGRVQRRGGRRRVERTVGMNETTGYGALATLVEDPDPSVAEYAEALAHCVQVTLESVEPTEMAETYDIEVEGVHLLCAGGFYASNTRRAAKMVILDVDHPDIEDFVKCKEHEEKKAWALIDAGYDGSLNGEAYSSVYFQNSNNSVRLPDAFMEAYLGGKDWETKARCDGRVMERIPAKKLMREIAEAAHASGDPGLQFDTTIQEWNPCSKSDRINATNPCVTGDTLISTADGLAAIRDLVGKTVDVVTADGVSRTNEVFKTGVKPIFRLRTRSGYALRLTADHPVATANRGDVKASELRSGDELVLVPGVFGTERLDRRMAELIGLAIGDGCESAGMIVWTMGREEAGVLEDYIGYVNDLKPDRMIRGLGESPTGVRFSTSAKEVAPVIRRYATLDQGSAGKRLLPVALRLDRDGVAGILRGLFTADGTVAHDEAGKNAYVALDSVSLDLLRQVQQLLLGFGIKAKIYEDRRGDTTTAVLPDGRGGNKEYPVQQMHSLRISRSSRMLFETMIGFHPASPKAAKLRNLNETVSTYADRLTDEFESLEKLGEEEVYDLCEPRTHHFVAGGLLVHNCSEFVFLDDTACNLASLNLMRFRKPDGEFDVASFRHACATTILAQEIIVDNASYPRERIAERSHAFRPLGLGYANLGALLMARGIPYDSETGRSITSAVTATLTGEAYRTSALVAEALGPFSSYPENREPFQRVMRKHRDSVAGVDARLVPADLMEAARKTWDDVVELTDRYGARNAQATVIAPTGTIAFMMDCDTTGVEPDIALVKYKRLVGGGVLKIVNRTVPEALQKLGYSAEATAAILGHIEQKGTIEGAPGLKPEHLPVFDCAFKPAAGVRVVSPMGHVRMVAAVQPYVSGSISKTINVPNEFTVEQVEDIYVQSWRLGLKCIALYRDGCKRTQPLSTSLESTSKKAAAPAGNGKATERPAPAEPPPVATAPAPAAARHIAGADAPPIPSPISPGPSAIPTPVRRRLPDERRSITHKFSVGGHEGYITVGMYEDGTAGEIFITMAKEGSVVSGLMDTVATSSSIALQYGVPLRVLVNKFTHTRFEPAGLTNNPKIPIAKSVIDYVFRWLELKFLAPEGEAAPHAEPAAAVPDRPTTAIPKSAAAEVAAGTIAEEDEAALAASAVQAVEGRVFEAQSDSPPCPDCGSIMVRSGACYRCLNCGAQNGCS